MVNKAIVLETIKKMYGSGIDDSTIEQTLVDIGLSKKEIAEYTAEAKGEAAKPVAAAKGPSFAAATAPPRPMRQPPSTEALKQEIAERHAEQEAMHTTTHAALQEQTAKAEEFKSKLSGLEQKIGRVSSGPSNRELQDSIAAINQKLGALQKQLQDLRAAVKATNTVMEKVLETDRKVLNRL